MRGGLGILPAGTLPGRLEGAVWEMEEQRTLEAKIFKALDKMEALISHNEADISTWLPLEYELNLTYGRRRCSFQST